MEWNLLVLTQYIWNAKVRSARAAYAKALRHQAAEPCDISRASSAAHKKELLAVLDFLDADKAAAARMRASQ